MININNINYKKVMFNPVINDDILKSIKEEDEDIDTIIMLFSSLSL